MLKQAVLFTCVTLPFALAQKTPLVLNTTYTCYGDSHIQILSCSGTGNDARCKVQYLNAAAPDGKGALLEMYRATIEDGYLKTCSLPPGTVVPASTANRDAAPVQRASPAAVKAPAAAAVQQTKSACAGAFKTGAALEARWRTSWYPATLVDCNAGQYRIRYDSDKSEEVVDETRVRSSAATAVSPGGTVSAASSVRAGSYGCSAFIGTPPNGHMQPMPGITILAGGAYVHATGGARGTYTYDPAQSLIIFKGGNMDGQAARYELSRTGKSSLHIYNERRSRTVIDCDM